MLKEIVGKWCDNLKKAWIEKDFKSIDKIFYNTKFYYEDPFSSPGTTSLEIHSFWEEIKYQKIKMLIIEPISIDDQCSIVHWYLDYTDIRDESSFIMDGIYQLIFDENFDCIFFKQWWVMKD